MSLALPPRPVLGNPAFVPEAFTATSSGPDIQALVAEIPLPMWVYDTASLRILAVNAAALRAYGYSRAEFLQLTSDRLRPAEDRTAFLDHLHRVAVGGARARVRHLAKDGRSLQVEVIADPFSVSGRKVRRVIAVDVAASVEVEEERTRLSHAVEQAAEAILITDTLGTLIYVNPAFELVSGYTRAEALGANPRLLKSGRQDPAFYEAMWATLRRGEVWRGRLVNRHKDGSLFEEEATISPVRDPQGAIRNFVAVKRDITRERSLEEQVRQSAKMEAIGRLAGGVAHDFNNLIGVVSGYAELGLRKLEPESEVRRHLNEILRASDRAASLTRQLLALSRRQVLQPRVIDLNVVVRDMDRLLGRLIGEDVLLETRLSDSPLFVLADPGQVEQVVMNLAINARDAMPDGGRLRLSTDVVHLPPGTAADLPAGAYAAMHMTDTGCGMDAETMSHVFEPFFTTKPEGKGTGLGLATVWGIVKQSGGSVTISSEPRAGTTFRILLPRVDGGQARAAVRTAAAVATTGAGEHASTVLVVDDEAPLRSIMRDVLEAAGHRVVEAADASEAMAAAARNVGGIDLLVTDLTMPGIDGGALVRHFRATHPTVRVLVMSGLAERTANAPDTAFLAKPFTTAELERAVRDALA